MIKDVPEAIPVTLPVPLIVATEVVPLAHVPPVLASVNVIAEPAQTGTEPKMAKGSELTVTTVVTEQPVASA